MSTQRSFDLSPLLHAAAAHLGEPVAGDVRWLHCSPEDLAFLTDADRELVSVLTGERLPSGPDEDVLVSFLVLQLVTDRVTGALASGDEVDIPYVEDLYVQYDETCPAGNPMSGDLFDLALAFLVGRDLARLGPDVVTTN